MSAVLFAYPAATSVERTIPKARVLAQATQRRGLKDRLSAQVEALVWACKLAPESLKLPPSPDLTEVQVFRLQLKPGLTRPDDTLLCAIDQAIPSPILFELHSDAGLCTVAAFKRPNESDPSRWVLGDYLWGDWLPANSPRVALPVALDMGGLYRALLRTLIPLEPRSGESLRDQLERLSQLRQLERDDLRLAKQLSSETQFKRKVELNRHLRTCRATMAQLRR